MQRLWAPEPIPLMPRGPIQGQTCQESPGGHPQAVCPQVPPEIKLSPSRGVQRNPGMGRDGGSSSSSPGCKLKNREI